MGRQGQATFRGESYESLALATPVPYPHPLAQFAVDPRTFEFWWRLLYFALRLPSPYEIPRITGLAPIETLHRYCDAATELASSACLAHGSSVNVRVARADDGSHKEFVESSFPPGELIRGFLVLFRQFYANEEAASFTKVKSILMMGAKGATDANAEHRLNMLKAWGKGHGRLRAYNAKYLVGERLVEEGRLGEVPDGGSPATLISAFAYGEHIHWGNRREEIARWRADDFLGPWNQLRFLEAMAGLAYFYMGYAVIVAFCIGRSDLTN